MRKVPDFRQSLRNHQLVVLSFIAVNAVSLLPISPNPLVILVGHVITLPLYLAYIVVSVGLLILPFTRLFPSIRGELKRSGWWAIDIILCTFILSQGLKYFLKLPRPSGSPSGAISGHTAFAFGLAWLIMKTYPRLGPFWFGAAIVIGWSRVQTEAHYPYQVPLGAIIGLLLGWAITHYTEGLALPRCLTWKRSRLVRSPKPPGGQAMQS